MYSLFRTSQYHHRNAFEENEIDNNGQTKFVLKAELESSLTQFR